MAPPTIHLMVARTIAEKLDMNMSGSFLLGTVAPDAILARIDYTAEQLNNSHFRKEGIKDSWLKAKTEFLSGDDAFAKGYAIHIMVDVLWITGIYLKYKDKLQDDFSIKKYNDDITFIEKWLCNTSKNNQLWQAITGAKLSGYNIYISPGELDLYKSQKYKSIVYDDAPQKMNYMSVEDINQFVVKAAKRIINELE